MRVVFPSVQVHGCVFHFTQALYRKVQFYGLAPEYAKRGVHHHFLRMVMALPFIPAEHSREAFASLQEHGAQYGSDDIAKFMDYVNTTWFQNSVWSPDNWSVFQQTVRTNNNVEGWHHRLNVKMKHTAASIYRLIPALYDEAQTVEIQIQQVSEMALSRYQKKTYVRLHKHLFKLWNQYMDDELTTSELLKSAARISGFGPTEDPAASS